MMDMTRGTRSPNDKLLEYLGWHSFKYACSGPALSSVLQTAGTPPGQTGIAALPCAVQWIPASKDVGDFKIPSHLMPTSILIKPTNLGSLKHHNQNHNTTCQDQVNSHSIRIESCNSLSSYVRSNIGSNRRIHCLGCASEDKMLQESDRVRDAE
jgi:hypothetical protein